MPRLAAPSMQITLLPPLLPSQPTTAVQRSPLPLAPGLKVWATVLGTTADGATLLSLGGREVTSSGSLPYEPGTALHLTVVKGGETPSLRIMDTAARAAVAPPEGDAGSASSPGAQAVSPVNYGLAAAVLAARADLDVRAASLSLARWIPALTTAGVLTREQGEALTRALAAVPVPMPPPSNTAEAQQATLAVARALAARVANSGLLMERRLADVIRQPGAAAEGAAAADVRARLALLDHLLQDAGPALEGARAAVAGVQEALLSEQARAAGHLARDGVVDLRVPLQVAGQDAELRLRMRVAREAPREGEEADPAPWRQVRLDLALGGIGRVQARLGVLPSQVRAEFVVERAEAADLIEAGLVDLAAALRGAGFAQVLSRVVVDPVRACAADDLPDVPPQRGIVDARA